MSKKYKKLLLGLGTMSMIGAPIASVVAGANDFKAPAKQADMKITQLDKGEETAFGREEKARIDGITAATVTEFLQYQSSYTPDGSINVPKKPGTFKKITLNGAKFLTLQFTKWTPNYVMGMVNFEATITKDGFVPKTVAGAMLGWRTDQHRINDIDQGMVETWFDSQLGYEPDEREGLPTNPGTITDTTINGVKGLTVEFVDWYAYGKEGYIDYKVIISKDGYTSRTIIAMSQGWRSDDKEGIRGITKDQVSAYVQTLPGYKADAAIPAPTQAPAAQTLAVINGVITLDVEFSNWRVWSDGTIRFTAKISKDIKTVGVVSKTLNDITITGFAPATK